MGKPYRVAPNGQRVDYVWMDETTENEPDALEIQRNMWVQRPKFEAYGIGHVIVNLFGIALTPIVGMIGLYAGWLDANRAFYLFAGIAVCAVLNIFAEPGLQVLRYSFGVQNNQAARDAYTFGKKDEAHEYLQAAIASTTPMPPALQSRVALRSIFDRKSFQ